MRIKNTSVLITGAGSGLGAGTAQHLATLGANLYLLDNNEEATRHIASQLKAKAFICDVADPDQVKETLNSIHQETIPQIIINCAGIIAVQRIVGRQEEVMPLEAFHKVLHVNLLGTFNVMRLSAGAMAKLDTKKERGVIINTASIAAFEGQIGQTAYSAAKGGIVAMTLPAARELASLQIRVVTIAPGIMDTPMMKNLSPEVQQSLSAQVPYPKRLGQTAEYASLVQHIIENSYINGSVIRLDGGIRMNAK